MPQNGFGRCEWTMGEVCHFCLELETLFSKEAGSTLLEQGFLSLSRTDLERTGRESLFQRKGVTSVH